MTVIVDLDGTLADFAHRVEYAVRGHWDLFHSYAMADQPVEPVAQLLRLLSAAGWKVVMMTGRPRSMEQGTRRWLHDVAAVQVDELWMREDGDQRHDWELKMEWAERYDEVQFVLEDRDCVVTEWRKAGYVCFQTAKGVY